MSRKFTFIQGNGESFPEWEEKTLGNVLYEPKKEAVDDPSKTELITVKLYGKGIERTGRFPNKTANARPYYIRSQGELIIGRQNFHNGGMGILPSDLDGLIASNAISSYTLREEVKGQSSMEFIHFLISRKDFYSKVDKLIGGTGQKELSRSEFNKLRIPLPSLPEQQKIAEFFSALDERIALTADKVELLKEQKAGYLQKIFNRELVFTDDNGDTYGDWEQKKLGEVAELYQPQTISGKDLKTEGYPVYGANGQIGFYDRYNHETEQVTVTCRGNTCGTLNYTVPRSWITGNAMVINPFEAKATKRFLYYCLESINFDYIVTGSGQPQITRGPLALVSIKLPSLPEQAKIAEFFSALDEQIQLTEKKLVLLKEQKKGYLQGIFG